MSVIRKCGRLGEDSGVVDHSVDHRGGVVGEEGFSPTREWP